jgi:adenylyltransferase/sulfurtransferase
MGMDVIVDGLDRMTPRYALNRACIKLGVPYVFGAVITNVGNATTIIPGETACLECFRGNVNDDVLPTCSVVGVHPSIISVIASIQTSETIRILLGKRPNLANTLIFCDLRDLSFEKIQLVRIDNCPICGTSPPLESSPIKQDLVQEICGRTGRRVFVFTPEKDLDLDLKVLNNHLKNLGYILKVEANLGTTFSKGPKIHGSILKSGVTILEGLKSEEEATQLQSMLLNLF